MKTSLWFPCFLAMSAIAGCSWPPTALLFNCSQTATNRQVFREKKSEQDRVLRFASWQRAVETEIKKNSHFSDFQVVFYPRSSEKDGQKNGQDVESCGMAVAQIDMNLDVGQLVPEVKDALRQAGLTCDDVLGSRHNELATFSISNVQPGGPDSQPGRTGS